jgi:hypothetical protein
MPLVMFSRSSILLQKVQRHINIILGLQYIAKEGEAECLSRRWSLASDEHLLISTIFSQFSYYLDYLE